MAMEMNDLAMDDPQAMAASPDAADMGDLTKDETEEQQTTNREVEQNLEAEDEPSEGVEAQVDKVEAHDDAGSDVQANDSVKETTTPTAHLTPVQMLIATKNAKQRAARGVNASSASKNNATQTQSTNEKAAEYQATDILDSAASMAHDTLAAGVGIASTKAKAKAANVISGRSNGHQQVSGAISANNSIDASYMTGNVSALGMPVMLQNGQQAIVMIGTPVIMLNGTYATMGTNGITSMDLSAGNNQNNGNVLRNAFMAGFMAGANGHGFMNGFMQSMGRQMGVAGLNALRGQPMMSQGMQGVLITQQSSPLTQSKGFDMDLQSETMGDIGKPKENDLSGADINNDGIANDNQQVQAQQANADNPQVDGNKPDLSSRRVPDAALLGHTDGMNNDGLDMGA